MEDKKKSLQKSIRKNIMVFALLIIIVLGTLIGVQYWYTRIGNYTQIAYNYTRTAAGLINGDKIKKYVETGDKDRHYHDVEKVLSATVAHTDIEYYYVFVPYKDEVVYVWDGMPADGEPAELGYSEPYMSAESKAAVSSIYRKDPPEKLNLQRNSQYGFIGSAYSPVFDSAGDPVAVVGADISMPGVLLAVWRYILLIVLVVTTLTIGALYVFYRRVDRNVIHPIKELEQSTREMVSNIERDESIVIDVHTGDELEELADSITQMDGDLRKYIRELSDVTAERERINAELSVATAIQEGVLPQIFPPFPDKKEFDLYATMDPAKQVGGDFYDFFLTDDDHIALVMADVSGKGVPAALFMMVSKLLIKNAVQAGLAPADALAKVNEQLLENNSIGYFVTVWLAVIDIRSGEGIVSNCGHENPALKHKGGTYEIVRYQHSPAVATLEGIVYKEHEIRLEPGDMLFVYTDGVTEATNSDNEFFGERRLLDSLNEHAEAGPEELLPLLKEDIDAFVCDAPQFDDVTMLAFRYNGK